MFEAHTLSAYDSELNLEPVTDKCWRRTFTRTHKTSLRPLKIWLADGKRKDCQQNPQDVWFIYVEYRTNRGENHFVCLERTQTGQTVEQLLAVATSVEIPDLSR